MEDVNARPPAIDSDAGAQRFSIMLSLIETMKKRGEIVFDTLVALLGGSFISAQLEREPT